VRSHTQLEPGEDARSLPLRLVAPGFKLRRTPGEGKSGQWHPCYGGVWNRVATGSF
jgi:hypothetical protein